METLKALKQLKSLQNNSKKMRLAAENWKNDWQMLVSIMLSARTRDEVTIEVCENIFLQFPTMEEFSQLKIPHIMRLIGRINFFENKSKYLYLMTQKLINEFDSEVPLDFEKLMTLPGVGRKTANVFLAEKGGSNIGVDTHVGYISRYLGWTDKREVEKIEYDLMKLFPKEKWREINKTLVGFGKTYTIFSEKNKILDEVKKIK
jgi:endonuclease III